VTLEAIVIKVKCAIAFNDLMSTIDQRYKFFYTDVYEVNPNKNHIIQQQPSLILLSGIGYMDRSSP